MSPVPFPNDWRAARAALVSAPSSGDAVSLPWQAFRRFDWNAGRTVLDPTPRFFDRPVVVNDALPVRTDGGQVIVGGEDPRSRDVEAALRSGRPVADTLPPLGVGWVLVAKDTPGEVPPELLTGAAVVSDGPTLTLYRLPSDGLVRSPGWPAITPAVAAVDVVALMLWWCCVLVATPLVRRLLRLPTVNRAVPVWSGRCEEDSWVAQSSRQSSE